VIQTILSWHSWISRFPTRPSNAACELRAQCPSMHDGIFKFWRRLSQARGRLKITHLRAYASRTVIVIHSNPALLERRTRSLNALRDELLGRVGTCGALHPHSGTHSAHPPGYDCGDTLVAASRYCIFFWPDICLDGYGRI
jgi:hypothetical protein